jgi:hypothetical protein
MLWDDSFMAAAASKGVDRSKLFNWDRTARLVYETYEQAIDHRQRCGSA